MKYIPDVKFLGDLENFVDMFIKRTRKLLKHSDLLKELKPILSFEKYYSEYMSLRIGLPRRSGNTTIAMNLLKKYPKSVYIGYNKMMAEEGLRRFNTLNPNGSRNKKNADRFFSLRPCTSEGIPFSPGVIVITDCLQFSSKSTMDKLYQRLDYCDPIYINLG
jgi:hypothetical protein